MDSLPKLIANFKENSVKLNDIQNQQNTNIGRMSRYFEKIWKSFAAAKSIAVPDNAWYRFRYKGFKVKGNSVRIIGHAPYFTFDDRSVTVPLSVIDKGPAEVYNFLVNKVKDDVVAAAERQKKEDDDDAQNSKIASEHSYYASMVFLGCNDPTGQLNSVLVDGKEIDFSSICCFSSCGFVIFAHFPLEKYGNRIPEFDFEFLCLDLPNYVIQNVQGVLCEGKIYEQTSN